MQHPDQSLVPAGPKQLDWIRTICAEGIRRPAPMYLFDSQDTLDKIHEQSLEPVTRAAVRIIASTRGVSAAAMRAGVERDRKNG